MRSLTPLFLSFGDRLESPSPLSSPRSPLSGSPARPAPSPSPLPHPPRPPPPTSCPPSQSEAEALNGPGVNVTFLVCVIGVPTHPRTDRLQLRLRRSQLPDRRPSAPVSPSGCVIVFNVPVDSIVTALPAIGFPCASRTVAVTAPQSTPSATAVALSTCTSEAAALNAPAMNVTFLVFVMSVPAHPRADRLQLSLRRSHLRDHAPVRPRSIPIGGIIVFDVRRRLDRHDAPAYRVALRIRHEHRHRDRVHPVRHRRRLVHLHIRGRGAERPRP